jgi:protease IV
MFSEVKMNKSRPVWIAIGAVVVVALILALFNVIACVGSYAASSRVASFFSGPGQGSAVGVIRVEGTIVAGQGPVAGSSGTVYSDQLVNIIEGASKNRTLKAIVLRVDSPGGSVVASNEIYNALLKVDKPIVVSMGEMAASGGYYISCAADKIVVNPATLTGSIGVIAEMPNVQGLMGKIGVDVAVVKSGRLKDEGSPFRPMTDEEKAVWQTIINEAYDQFVGIVAKGRNLSDAKVREIADGRVYTGLQAIKLGLADKEGNLNDAIDLAGQLGGINGTPRTIELVTRPSFLESLLTSAAGSSKISLDLQNTLGVDLTRPTLQYIYLGG